MKLLDYLNNHYIKGFNLDSLVNDFLNKFGVNVKNEGHLYLFKYNQLEANWKEDITYECRGVILSFINDNWKIVSRPFDKFFNQSESYCPLYNEKDFNKELNNLFAVQKCDGSCIQVYYDDHIRSWRVSTLGLIVTANVYDSPLTFEQLFNKIVPLSFFDNLPKGNTYIFELCTVYNRVVTKYDKDKVYILGVRNIESGELWNWNDVIRLSDSNNIYLPERKSLSELGLQSLTDVYNWIEQECKKSDIYGEYAEGMVLYNQYGPVCKMKTSIYIALHHSLSDVNCTRKAIIHSFFKETLDDLYPALPDEFKKFCDKLKEWARNIQVHLNTTVAPSFRSVKFKDRKEYALYVNDLPQPEGMFKAFFFQYINEVCDSNINLGHLFIQWLQKNNKGRYVYESYMDYWRSLENN